MTPERNRAESTETFRCFVTMLAQMQANIVGWQQVALVLAECASDAMVRAADDREPPRP